MVSTNLTGQEGLTPVPELAVKREQRWTPTCHLIQRGAADLHYTPLQKECEPENKMLDTRDIIILTAAFYLGSVVSKFFGSLTDGIIMPLLAPAVAAEKGVSAFTVKFGSTNLKIGQALVDLINLIVSFVIVVFTIGLLRTYVLSRIGARRNGGDDE